MTLNSSHFWSNLDALVRTCRVVIDRPKGTAHPRFPDFIYPYDYGYLEGSQAMDGGGIDVWIGSLADQTTITGVIATVDLEKKDSEIKILIACTAEESAEILKTHNDGPQAGIFIARK